MYAFYIYLLICSFSLTFQIILTPLYTLRAIIINATIYSSNASDRRTMTARPMNIVWPDAGRAKRPVCVYVLCDERVRLEPMQCTCVM